MCVWYIWRQWYHGSSNCQRRSKRWFPGFEGLGKCNWWCMQWRFLAIVHEACPECTMLMLFRFIILYNLSWYRIIAMHAHVYLIRTSKHAHIHTHCMIYIWHEYIIIIYAYIIIWLIYKYILYARMGLCATCQVKQEQSTPDWIEFCIGNMHNDNTLSIFVALLYMWWILQSAWQVSSSNKTHSRKAANDINQSWMHQSTMHSQPRAKLWPDAKLLHVNSMAYVLSCQMIPSSLPTTTYTKFM